MALANLLIPVSRVISHTLTDMCVMIFYEPRVSTPAHTSVLGLEVSVPRARTRRETGTLVSRRADPLEDPVRDRTRDHV